MEEIKKCSSNTMIMETDSGCTVVLELPENDPFFDIKKNLLLNKGFNIREEIQLEGSSHPVMVDATLDKIHKIARILQLDEVELYFGEGDQSSLVEYYSHRNEMEALNLILSLINSLLSGKTCEKMNTLQALHEATIKRVSQYAEKIKVETVIDKSYSCDVECCLVEWGEKNGVKTRLKISRVEGSGRGAIAMEDLNVGDIALEIPLSVIIYEELVHKSDMYHIFKKIDCISSETMLLLWSMKEKHNSNSKFKLYFNALPKEFNTGLSFGVDAILSLDGTILLEEIMQAKEHLRAQYDELVPALCNNHPDVFPSELYTWEHFLWACELWYSNGMKVMFADRKLRTCLIPIAGFLNHSIYPHVVHYGKVDSITNTLKFPLSRPCHVGEECCLSYGNFSSSHLITFYGFLPKGDNPYDIIPLDIDVDDPDCNEDRCVSSWTTHMVRATWLSNNHNLFNYGLPSALLDHLRSARSPTSHTKTITQSNMEIEIELLEDLRSIFGNMMENLGETDPVDRENASWDVKLSLDFKDLQRRIVSSILISCDAGLKLVCSELSKCSE